MTAARTRVSGRRRARRSTSSWTRAGRIPSPSTRHDDGFFEGTIRQLSAGERYWFRIDGDRLRPDPVSRSQPEGPHGPSAVVDPGELRVDRRRVARRRPGRPGALRAARRHVHARRGRGRRPPSSCRRSQDLGVTVVEMMPIADFPGSFGWGYDGVNLYAPTRLYGTPDDLRRFVDRAHAMGSRSSSTWSTTTSGRTATTCSEFAADYFTDKYKNDWGRAHQFRGTGAGAGVLRRERRLLDRRVPLRRPAPRRDAGHQRRLARTRARGRWPAARGRRPGAVRFTSSPRTSRSTP